MISSLQRSFATIAFSALVAVDSSPTWAQSHFLAHTFDDPTFTEGDGFGSSVAIDGNRVLVGAPFDDTYGNSVGQVHLFDAISGSLLRTFDDPMVTSADSFGSSVAIDGDRVLIGSSGDDTTGLDVGQAHLFNAGTGDLLHTFNDPTPTGSDSFGSSVAVDGNYVLIGAGGDDTQGQNVSQAHLFDATTGGLLHTFDDPTVTDNDFFGTSVAVHGNYVLIGAPGDNTFGDSVGQAHLFDASTGALLRTFDDPAITAKDSFGFSAALHGNYVLIGAPGNVTSGAEVSQAYLFNATTGGLLQTFDDPSSLSGDGFGISVAIDNDWVLIGAFRNDSAGTNVGRAHLFDTSSGLLLDTFDDPTVTTQDHFGKSVALDGDGVIIGEIFDSTPGLSVGQAHLFRIRLGDIIVDPDGVGATDVVGDPSGLPMIITNPVADPLNVSELAVGDASTGAILLQGDGEVNVDDDMFVGLSTGSGGTVTMTGGTLNVGTDAESAQRDLEIGYQGTGVFEQSGGIINVGQKLYLGSVSGGQGTLKLTGGVLNVGERLVIANHDTPTTNSLEVSGEDTELNITTDLHIGNHGTGRLSVSGGQVTANRLTIGNNASGMGELLVTFGALDVATEAIVGHGGTGSLGMTGGTLTIDGTLTVKSGLTEMSSGSVNLTGGTLSAHSVDLTNGGSLNHTGGTLEINGGVFDDGISDLEIGLSGGNPTLRFVNGASEVSSTISVAADAGGGGRLEVSGSATRVSATGGILIGYLGTGTALVEDGATLSTSGISSFWVGYDYGSNGALTIASGGKVVANANAFVGTLNGSTGVVNVDGPNSTWTIADRLEIGNTGTGTLRVNGGQVTANRLIMGDDARAVGTLTMTFGSLDVATEAIVGQGGAGTLGITGGALTIADTLTVKSDATAFSSGVVHLSGGTLSAAAVDNSRGGEFNFTGGELRIDEFDGSLAQLGGTLAVRSPLGTMQITGNYTMDEFAVFATQVADPNLLQADTIDVVGDATLSGEIYVDVPDGFETILSSPISNSKFVRILSAENVIDNGVMLTGPGAAFFNLSVDADSVYLVAFLRGDYNGDGIVNIADYTVWRDTLGATGIGLAADGNRDQVVDALDYGVWRSNFGEFVFTGPQVLIGVPEPVALSSVAIALMCFASLHLRVAQRFYSSE